MGNHCGSFFAENSVVEQIIDFGHAPIFEDADVFPCIVSVRIPEGEKVEELEKPQDPVLVQVCSVPRKHLENINLPQYINQEGYQVPWSRFSSEEWSLETSRSRFLNRQVEKQRCFLWKNFLKQKPYYGGKRPDSTQSFLITEVQREELIQKRSKVSRYH